MTSLGLLSQLRRWKEPGEVVFDFSKMAVLDPRWKVIRTGTKTYIDDDGVRKTIGPGLNVPVLDPVHGRVVDIEPQSTNLITQSANPAAWSGAAMVNPTPASLKTVAGILLGKFSPTTQLTPHYIDRTFPLQAEGTPISCQLAIQAGELSKGRIELFTGGGASLLAVPFDLLAGTWSISANSTGATVRVRKLAGDVWIFYVENAKAVAGTVPPRYRVVAIDNTGTQNFVGDGVQGFWVGEMQAETRTSCTSFIPTLGSAVTRSAEYLIWEGVNLAEAWNPAEGMVLLDTFMAQETIGSTGFQTTLTGTAGDRVDFRRTVGGNGPMYGQVVIGGVSSANNSTMVLPNGRFLVGYQWNAGVTRLGSNGGAIVSPTSLIINPAIATSIRLGSPSAGVHLKVRSFRMKRTGQEDAAEFYKRITQ